MSSTSGILMDGEMATVAVYGILQSVENVDKE